MQNKTKEQYNISICILKIWMSFEVVLAHYRSWDETTKNVFGFGDILHRFVPVAVPAFMLLAFALTDVSKISNLPKRMYRLVAPHVIWAIIYYLVYRYFTIEYQKAYIYSKSDFLWQVFTGGSYNGTAWFQAVLIYLTLLYSAIYLMPKKFADKIIAFLTIASLMLQYSGVNAHVFDAVEWPTQVFGGHFEDRYLVYVVGRYIEMIPYASIGIILSRQKWNINKKFFFVFPIISYLLLKMELLPVIDGYGYQGITLIIASVLLVVSALVIKVNIKDDVIQRLIEYISKRTMAIYFMHRLVAESLYTTGILDKFMVPGSFRDCCIIWIISLIIALLFSFVPIKLIKTAF